MKQIARHAFTDAELDQLRSFVGRKFDGIFSDGVLAFRFVSGTEIWDASPVDSLASSQNEDDEIVAVRLAPATGTTDRGIWNLLASGVSIEDIHIVRALVWFTDHREFAGREDALTGAPAPRDAVDEQVRELIAGSTGGHEEVITHPSAIETVDAPVANLVDVGFVARVEELELACFAWGNSFIRECDYITEKNRADVLHHYQLVALDSD